MSPEDRRKLFERIVSRIEAQGNKFENDPGFLASVDKWIEGKIDIKELRGAYEDLVRSRYRRRESQTSTQEDT